MKSETKPPESRYPCLKINRSTGTVVLFVSPNEGTIVAAPDNLNLGRHTANFYESRDFVHYDGTVTLTN